MIHSSEMKRCVITCPSHTAVKLGYLISLVKKQDTTTGQQQLGTQQDVLIAAGANSNTTMEEGYHLHSGKIWREIQSVI